MTKAALILVHEHHEGAAIFADILDAKGFKQEIVFAPKDNLDNLNVEADLVMIMGGTMGVYEADQFPFINKELDFIKRRIAANRSILGICLGSQMMAAALGANVYKGKQGTEIGWHDIKVSADGMKTPAHHLDGAMFHWHGDTFDLPQGAKLLASSAQYPNQIFSYGENALAIQCHPEVKADDLEGWFAFFEKDMPAETIQKLRLETKANISTLQSKSKMFFTEWLESVGL